MNIISLFLRHSKSINRSKWMLDLIFNSYLIGLYDIYNIDGYKKFFKVVRLKNTLLYTAPNQKIIKFYRYFSCHHHLIKQYFYIFCKLKIHLIQEYTELERLTICPSLHTLFFLIIL